MVCQRLALIMGFVSVCLRKWHARVHWWELASVAVCLCAKQVAHVCEKKNIYGRLYFGWAGGLGDRRVYICVYLNTHKYCVCCTIHSPSVNEWCMGSWAGTSGCARFFIR